MTSEAVALSAGIAFVFYAIVGHVALRLRLPLTARAVLGALGVILCLPFALERVHQEIERQTRARTIELWGDPKLGMKLCMYTLANKFTGVTVVPQPWQAADCKGLSMAIGQVGVVQLGCSFYDGKAVFGPAFDASNGVPRPPDKNCGW